MAPTSGFAAGIETNDIILAYSPEATWGTTAAVALQELRVTGEGFTATKSRTRPSEMNTTGAVSAAVTQKFEAKGDFKFALSTATPLDLFEASIMGVNTGAKTGFAAAITVASVTGGSAGFTDSANGFTSGNKFHVGDWIHVTGFASTGFALVNGYYQILTLAAGAITTFPAPGAAISAGAGDPVTITGTTVANGNTFNSFYFEKKLAAALFLKYNGSSPTGGSISASTGNFFSGDMQFLCKDQVKATATGGSGANTAAGSGVVIDTVNGFGAIYRGSAVLGGTLAKIDLKWAQNSARAQYGMGSTSAAGIGKGLLEVSGSMEVYFKDFTLYDEFINETAAQISFRGVDLTGAGYIFTLPNATIMNPTITAGGPSQDIMATFQIEGNPSAAASIWAGASFQITKV